MDLLKWIEENKINCEVVDDIAIVSGFGKLLYIKEKDGRIIDKDYSLLLNESEYDILDEDKDIKYILFKFGNRFYYSSLKEFKNDYNELVFKPEFNDFCNIGDYEKNETQYFSNLGCHTGYELLNGSGEAESWCGKAKFYKQDFISTIDKNTLGGSLSFQLACEKKNLKFAIGYTATIAYDYSKDSEHQQTFDGIFYVKNEIGWRNLLRINKAINVDFDKFCPEEIILENSDGLFFVFPKDSIINFNINKSSKVKETIQKYKDSFGEDNIFYQLDFTEMTDDSLDIQNLKNSKIYLEKYSNILNPIYIPDSYYVEKIDYKVKEYLNGVDKISKPHSKNQYFKDIDDIFDECIDLFSNQSEFAELFISSLSNTEIIAKNCDFRIDLMETKLPKFEVDNVEEFYRNLIEERFDKKIKPKFIDDPKKLKIYKQRIKIENDVIIGAGFVDYFLILWDVIEFCKKSNILVGPGRGSAAGSLIAYILGIVEIDPIEYGLLFERFLNKSRVEKETIHEIEFKNKSKLIVRQGEEVEFDNGEKLEINIDDDFSKLTIQNQKIKSIISRKISRPDSLPDVDLDFEAGRRNEVKQYFRDKYGEHHVCSIGTYNRLKTKSAIKDFGRVKKLAFDKVNFATKEIPDSIKSYWQDIFENAITKKTLYQFVQENIEIIETMKCAMNQPKSGSVHASAIIIVPKEDKNGNPMTVFDWMPMKKIDGLLVSEWEGKYTDRAGFLKEDVLGLSQLDKFKSILEKIKTNTGKKVGLTKIPMNKDYVFDYFINGHNEDVFQFGTSGLKAYSKTVKPNVIDDLIAMNALYRPGPMESGSHTSFALIKNKKKEAEFDKGMEIITKDTYGLYVYQEQIMQAMVVGGLTLIESDEVRTIMKKKDFAAMEAFKNKFVLNYSEIIGTKEKAIGVWDKLFSFSAYGFNKSHSAAYSLMGYWSQYLKVRYPLEFWTASLNFSEEEEQIPNRLSEIELVGNEIIVRQPDINKSDIEFTCDPDTNTIYWSLTKIKFAGNVAIKTLLEVRNEVGQFYDLKDFMSKVPKAKVNKKVVTNFIIAGAFDDIGGKNGLPIQEPKQRLDILKNFCEEIKSEVPEDLLNNPNSNKNWFWITKQKEITGFGNINYQSLIDNKITKRSVRELYLSPEKFSTKVITDRYGEPSLIAGTISSIKTRKYKKGTMCNIILESNNALIPIVIWDEIYQKIKDQLTSLQDKKQIFAISGIIRFDSFKGKNILMSDENTKIYEI